MRARQQGQTLIETIVAIFILATGLSSGLGLAVYAFSASTTVSNQVLATNFAREGIEAVRRMRDSNWLAGSLVDCTDLGQQCYQTWLTSPYNISGSSLGKDYRLYINFSASNNNPGKWRLQSTASPDPIYYQIFNATSHIGFREYAIAGETPTQFFRKINIAYISTSGGYTAQSPLVRVRSVVWWHGRNCPEITDWFPTTQDTPCKVITEEYLTNWKNY